MTWVVEPTTAVPGPHTVLSRALAEPTGVRRVAGDVQEPVRCRPGLVLRVADDEVEAQSDPEGAPVRGGTGPGTGDGDRLGRLSYHQRGLHLAAPELTDLAERAGATADLALRSGPHAVIVAGGSVTPKTGLRRPLHSTALGKVLPAWARPGEGGPSLLPPLPAFADRTIIEPAALETELAKVRTDAYALNDGESAYGVRPLAVPVLDGAGYARFALAVRATPSVITKARTEWFLSQARSCARALEVLLLSPAERRPPTP
ncbi:IclR family transcriptional regulator [Streptomyces atratus]|uniref:IclR family transcriptional regulator n=1 Tax=Streptomyces atratus TaxID=1893 RepID=UPI003657C675